MAYILQLETATDVCSVAISNNGQLVCIRESLVSNSHTELITILIKQCIAEANISLKDLQAIAISGGPGSYTSLRVGVATAKGLCYGLKIPLLALDSLEALCYGIDSSQLKDNSIIIPMIDARRMEVYSANYDHGYKRLTDTEAIVIDETTLDYVLRDADVLLCGSGAEKCYNIINHPRLSLHHTSASSSYMSSLAYERFKNGQFEDLAYYSPNYFKAPNITKSTKKLF
jgi:tRNA threonylcarbamoyladenosine biosynthesis protein TsaB